MECQSSVDSEDVQSVNNDSVSSHTISLSKTNDITLIKGWRNKQFNVSNESNDISKCRNVTLLCDDLKNYSSDEPLIGNSEGINLDSLRVVLQNDHYKNIGEKIKTSSNSDLIKKLGLKIKVDDDLDKLSAKVHSGKISDANCGSFKSDLKEADFKEEICPENDKLNAFDNKTVDNFLCSDTSLLKPFENSLPPSLVDGTSHNLVRSDCDSESSSSGSSYIYIPRIPIKNSNVISIVDPIFDEYGRKPKTVFEKRLLLKASSDETEIKNLKTPRGIRESHFQYIGRNRKFDFNFRAKNAGKVLNNKFINSASANSKGSPERKKMPLRLLSNQKSKLYKKYYGNKLRNVRLKAKKSNKRLNKKVRNFKSSRLKKLEYVKPLARRLNQEVVSRLKKDFKFTDTIDNYNKNRKVVMVIYLGLGRSLYQEQLDNLNLLKKPGCTVIDSAWANFSASAVLNRNDPKKLTPYIVPVVSPLLISFMNRSTNDSAFIKMLNKNRVANSLHSRKDKTLNSPIRSRSSSSKEGFGSDITEKSTQGSTSSTVRANKDKKNKTGIKKRLFNSSNKDSATFSLRDEYHKDSIISGSATFFLRDEYRKDSIISDNFESVDRVIEEVILRSQDNMYNTDSIHDIISEVAEVETCDKTDEDSTIDASVVKKVAADSTDGGNTKKAGSSDCNTVVDNFNSKSKISLCRPILNAWRKLGYKKKTKPVLTQKLGSPDDKNCIISESAALNDNEVLVSDEGLNVLTKTSDKSVNENFSFSSCNGKSSEFDTASLASSDFSENSPAKKVIGSVCDKMPECDTLSQVSLADSDASEGSTAKKLNFRRAVNKSGKMKYTGKMKRVALELRRLNSDYLEVDDAEENPAENDKNADFAADTCASSSRNFISGDNMENLIPDDITERLAKVEKEYHQTVMKSNDEIIFFSSYSERNKRIKKLPRKLQDVILLGESEILNPIKDTNKNQHNELLDMDEITSIIRQQHSKETELSKSSGSHKIKSNISSSDSNFTLDSVSNTEVGNSPAVEANKIGVHKKNKPSPEKLQANLREVSDKLKLQKGSVKKTTWDIPESDLSVTAGTSDVVESGYINQTNEIGVAKYLSEYETKRDLQDMPLSERIETMKKENRLSLTNPVKSEEKNILKSELSKGLNCAGKSSEFVMPNNKALPERKFLKPVKNAVTKKKLVSRDDVQRIIGVGSQKNPENLLVTERLGYLKKRKCQNNLETDLVVLNCGEETDISKRKKTGKKKLSNHTTKMDSNSIDNLKIGVYKSKLKNKFLLNSKSKDLESIATFDNRKGSSAPILSKAMTSSEMGFNQYKLSKVVTKLVGKETILVQTSRSILKPNLLRNSNISVKETVKNQEIIKKNPFVRLEVLKLPSRLRVWCMIHNQYECLCLRKQNTRRVAIKRMCPIYKDLLRHKNLLQRSKMVKASSSVKSDSNNPFKYFDMSPKILQSKVNNCNSDGNNFVQTAGNVAVANLDGDAGQCSSQIKDSCRSRSENSSYCSERQDGIDIKLVNESEGILPTNQNDDQSGVIPRIESIMSLTPEEFYTDNNDFPDQFSNCSERDSSNLNSDTENGVENNFAGFASTSVESVTLSSRRVTEHRSNLLHCPLQSDKVKVIHNNFISNEDHKFFCIHMNYRFTYIKLLDGPNADKIAPYNRLEDMIETANKDKASLFLPLWKTSSQSQLTEFEQRFGIYAMYPHKTVFIGPYRLHEKINVLAFELGIQTLTMSKNGRTLRKVLTKSIPFVEPSNVKSFIGRFVQAQWWYPSKSNYNIPLNNGILVESPNKKMCLVNVKNPPSGNFVPLNQSSSTLIPNQVNLSILPTNKGTSIVKRPEDASKRVLTVKKISLLDPSTYSTTGKFSGSLVNVKFPSVMTEPVSTESSENVSKPTISASVNPVSNSITKTVSAAKTATTTSGSFVSLLSKTGDSVSKSPDFSRNKKGETSAGALKEMPIVLNVLPDGNVEPTVLYEGSDKDNNKVYFYYSKTTAGLTSGTSSSAVMTSAGNDTSVRTVNTCKTAVSVVNTTSSIPDRTTNSDVYTTVCAKIVDAMSSESSVAKNSTNSSPTKSAIQLPTFVDIQPSTSKTVLNSVENMKRKLNLISSITSKSQPDSKKLETDGKKLETTSRKVYIDFDDSRNSGKYKTNDSDDLSSEKRSRKKIKLAEKNSSLKNICSIDNSSTEAGVSPINANESSASTSLESVQDDETFSMLIKSSDTQDDSLTSMTTVDQPSTSSPSYQNVEKELQDNSTEKYDTSNSNYCNLKPFASDNLSPDVLASYGIHLTNDF